MPSTHEHTAQAMTVEELRHRASLHLICPMYDESVDTILARLRSSIGGIGWAIAIDFETGTNRSRPLRLVPLIAGVK